MRNDVLRAVAIVDSGLENRHFLFGDFCSPRASYQFFRFAAEHATANDLDPPCVSWYTV
jgi:hypothetical protein